MNVEISIKILHHLVLCRADHPSFCIKSRALILEKPGHILFTKPPIVRSLVGIRQLAGSNHAKIRAL
jgi:hypothetical protein